jgi:hypothetical protein
MKFASREDTGDLSANYTGPAFKIESMTLFAVCAEWAGNPTGTLALQASNNAFIDNVTGPNNNENPNATWISMTGSDYPTGGNAGQYFYNFDGAGFLAFRLIYTSTSGSGSIKAQLNAKGWQ